MAGTPVAAGDVFETIAQQSRPRSGRTTLWTADAIVVVGGVLVVVVGLVPRPRRVSLDRSDMPAGADDPPPDRAVSLFGCSQRSSRRTG